jgi:hypothetical protein
VLHSLDPDDFEYHRGVLPMIVLVYGGFCVIYCVCKGYDDCKKRKNKKTAKKKRLKDEDDEIITANSSGGQSWVIRPTLPNCSDHRRTP